MDTHDNSEEENISEAGACAAHNFETRKTLKTTNIESLPDDVVFDILARVPARDIYYGARLVCSNWYQTIRTHDFVRAHLQRSTCGLVIQPFRSSERDLKFATQKGPIIEIMSDFDYKFTGSIFSSCNGLILERDHSDKKSGWEYRITNPATKQHLVLPWIAMRSNNLVGMGLAYAVASKEYKAVRTMFNDARERECAILTVGVDEDWKRRVDFQHLSPSAKKILFSTETPLSTHGFVHWVAQHGSDCEYVVTLNVETEIIKQCPAGPPGLCTRWDYYRTRYSYLSMGRCLSLLIARIDKMCAIWDQVWVMEPDTGEWTKMMSIHSESLKRALQGIDFFSPFYWPVGWLKCREVLLFASCSSSSCIAYNVRTHEIESSFELGFKPCNFVAHQNSLVWLDGC